MKIKWVQFTKRTEDPKLAYIERLLTKEGISHKREGQSFHGPIVLVPEDQLGAAEEILMLMARKVLLLPVHHGVTLDDVPDDHRCFYADGKTPGAMFEECEAHWLYKPSDWIMPCGGDDPCGECQECLDAQDTDDPAAMGWVGKDGRP